MALMDWIGETATTVLEGRGVSLRHPRAADFAEWSQLRAASRDHLQPWEPLWPHDDLTRTAFRRRLTAYQREIELGHAYPFFIFAGGRLVGGATLSNIRRGVAETGTVGYWIGHAHAGRGYATEAVRALAEHAFGALKLHRLEAACLPANIGSRRVLEKAGFRREGEAKAYLKINGVWADHLLFGLLAEEVSRR